MNKHFLDRYSYLYRDESANVDRSIWHFDRDPSKATIANWEYRAHLDADGKVDGVIGIGC